MDVDGIVRTRRREQVRDALEFERDREAAIDNQLAGVLAELEGSRIDDAAFATMTPEDAAIVLDVLDPGHAEPVDEFDYAGQPMTESADEIRREHEDERARLEDVLEESRARQRALEAYLSALDLSALDARPGG